jgi:tetratricopeptide (TPR) repeat protein
VRRTRFALLAVAVALGLVVAGVAGYSRTGSAPQAQTLVRPGSAGTQPSSSASRDSLSVGIANAQQRLRDNDGDWATWAALGAAYVEEGRVSVDPSYYPKAEAALQRSLQLQPGGNFAAEIGLGALANARHEFADAVTHGQAALAANAYSSDAYGVFVDAYTQLGEYTEATAALQRMLDLKPGIPSFTRAEYDFEMHGNVAAARSALLRAVADATGASNASDIGFCRYYLGELAFNAGDVAEAAHQYALGLAADPNYDPLFEGKAKAEAASGDTAGAVRDYTTVVNRVPQPQYVIELGDLHASLGHSDAAQQQYNLLATEERLFSANGVVDDLLPAQFDADHGDPAGALSHARAEWSRRHSVLVADALAWALHVNGQDKEALTYAQQASRLGWQNALFSYHQGMIERSLGLRADAQRDLSLALHINPSFSVLQAPLARSALAELAGTP